MADVMPRPAPPGGSKPPAAHEPPPMALRTYRFLRLGVVGVIALLAVSLWKEYDRAGNCLQGSISAYYYTPVRSVFVGALVTLGLVMVALWGKSLWEDNLFNLAGILAPVVAFVPTAETNKCGLRDPAGAKVRTQAEQEALIEASHTAVSNNLFAYLAVIALMLAGLLIIGIVGQLRARPSRGGSTASTPWTSAAAHPPAYWIPWATAFALWAFGVYKFSQDRSWIFDRAHMYSAIVLFVLIVGAIVAIAVDKLRGEGGRGGSRDRRWALAYGTLSVVMALGAVVVRLLADTHPTFWVEAWMVFWLAVFWVLQTWDRWYDGAPGKPGSPEVLRT